MAGKTARALELLARVERRELDRERQDLAAVSGQLAAALDALARLDGRFGSELGLALAMPDGPRLAAAYAHGHRVRRAEGAAEVGRLGAEVGRLGEAVKARAVALRTLELAAERVEEREEAEVAARQQAQLDEVAVLRHAAAGRVRRRLRMRTGADASAEAMTYRRADPAARAEVCRGTTGEEHAASYRSAGRAA